MRNGDNKVDSMNSPAVSRREKEKKNWIIKMKRRGKVRVGGRKQILRGRGQ